MSQSSAFPAIGDYGLIGDCRTLALVSRRGSVEWLCLPDLDSPSLFARLLDRERGGFLAVAPVGCQGARRRYREGTNVLETELEAPDGRLRVTDCLPIEKKADQLLQPERELVRFVEVLEGSPEVEVVYAPAPGYGAAEAPVEPHGRLGWRLAERGRLVLLRSDLPLWQDGPRRVGGRERLRAGETRSLSLSFHQRDPAILPLLGEEVARKIEATADWWRDWSGACDYDGPFAEAVRRSALTLKALQFVLSGAVIAAASSSLPEALGGGRNWDYRFCWLRDAAFTLRAFVDTGFEAEAAAFFDWLLHATRLTQPRLDVLYDVYGRTGLAEKTLDHLAGYRGSRPVRIGNAASSQVQLDAYGEVISAAAIFIARGNRLDRAERRLLVRLGETVCRLWRQPDNGIWEFRGSRLHNTWSKVMCWSALDQLLALDDQGVLAVPRARFEAEREKLRETIFEQGYDRALGSFLGAFGESFLDATLLLLPRTGLIEADDPRMAGTYERIQERLGAGPLLHRYDAGTDGQEGQEGAFAICSFWAVEYLARAGRLDEARERMAAILQYRNDLGLLSEEIDADGGELLGNFPQGFSHSGLINAALAIAEAERGAQGLRGEAA
ncbi:Glucoamylase (glucan-1,4-alpha-glucosidase), GH15 family [Tistlia consotensis]|uniref:Glucoamylase (Glucan-1,4-alpha-glucosidase), GH15 family n=1 Tax=Tistlia consotensis USBA 355 TaxID=560819 RepID=A0A1Y6CT44_9PROT|nr:glycoside hydrolase family 15 protein [Tistlia consotensis]SMF76101.1 Glucoamylase (glucan-1,4-alpha-glucosidase), GH15 family [Tistlia consotensis USBA 355]SNS12231.1 Glucoamylase (glucan-1,4-alpha-glucosidase), GH15 family [Tistlia consotensis]